MTHRVRVGVLTVCAGLLAMQATASAEVRAGSGTDPAGDGGVPTRDITATELSYDTAGSVRAKVTLAAAPDAAALNSGVGLLLGTWNGQGCTLQLIVHASSAGGDRSRITLLAPGGETRLPGVPTLSVSGATVTVAAADPGLANKGWNCGGSETLDPVTPTGGDIQTVIPALTPVAGAKPPSRAAKLRKAIATCKRRHKGSRPKAKRARARCIRHARKKYGKH